MKLGRWQIGEFGRSVLKLGVGTAAGQGAVLLASPLWSRIYEPADFALLGLFLSFVSTVTVALALRYDLAIPLAMRSDDGARLLVLCLLLTVPLAVVGGAGMASMTSQDVLGFGALPMAAAPLAAFVLLVTGIFGALRYWHVGASHFGPISRSLVVQGVARATVPILLAPAHLGWFGLIAGEAVGRTLGIRRLIVSAMPTLRRMLQQWSWPQLWECARSYRRFPAIFLPSALLDAVAAGAALPVFLMFHSLTAAGHFMLAQQVVAAPAALLCAAMADVYHYKVTATARSEPAAVVPLLLRSAVRISAFALIALTRARAAGTDRGRLDLRGAVAGGRVDDCRARAIHRDFDRSELAQSRIRAVPHPAGQIDRRRS